MRDMISVLVTKITMVLKDGIVFIFIFIFLLFYFYIFIVFVVIVDI